MIAVARLCLLLASARALVAPAAPRRRLAPRYAAAVDLDAFLATRPAAKTFYEGVVASAGAPPLDPPPEQSVEEQTQMSALVDHLHAELMKLSVLADYEDEEGNQPDDVFDDFVEEGRKMLSISVSRVAHGEDRAAVSGAVWGGITALLASPEPDTGLLCALPEYVGDAATFLDDEIVAPLAAMGFGDQVEARAYRAAAGAPCPAFRLLVSPTAVPEGGAPTQENIGLPPGMTLM